MTAEYFEHVICILAYNKILPLVRILKDLPGLPVGDHYIEGKPPPQRYLMEEQADGLRGIET